MKTKNRVISLILVLNMLLFAFPFNSIAQDTITVSDDEVTGNASVENNIISDDNETSNYVKDEVLILLADTPKTQDMQFYSVYSDDYQAINDNLNEAQTASVSNKVSKIAESTEVIEDSLNLGIRMSEMRLLNPSNSMARNSLYQMDTTHNNIFSIKLDDMSVEEALEILNENPAIEIAEPNYLYELDRIPNDPEYNLQYALDNINAEEAWEITRGSKNVIVGIIDTGIDGTHPDLVDNLWNNPYYVQGVGCTKCRNSNGTYQYSNDIHGYNFTGYGNDDIPCGGTPTDTDGHGTHVAGIVGAKGNNSEGISGVNWNVSLAWLGTNIGGGGISVDAAIEALNYAENHNISITNNSYGGYEYSGIFERAISNYSGLFIAAAGNNGNNNDNGDKHWGASYPASYKCSNIISVASTDNENNLSVFYEGGVKTGESNYGLNSVHVAAPGSDIYSTYKGSSYKIDRGTSMASPFVSGIAALIKAKNPGFTTQQIKAVICGTVQKMNKTYNIMYDGGIVDAKAAVSVNSNSLKKVTFLYDYSGSVPLSFSDYAVSGKTILEPYEEPSKYGYVFKGWYETATGNELFDFTKPITSDITVCAQWGIAMPNTYGEKFPDYRFRNYVLQLLNEKDNELRTADSIISDNDIRLMKSFSILNVNLKRIRDLTGIEYFSNLQTLYCSNNLIEYFDLSKLTKLRTLSCNYNLITSLDLNYLTSLEVLECTNNQIKSLMIDRLNNLQKLDCSNNKLTTLTTGSGLGGLTCEYNNLTKLDVSASTMLQAIRCIHNHLSVINVCGKEIVKVDVRYNDMNDKSDVVGFESWPDIYGFWSDEYYYEDHEDSPEPDRKCKFYPQNSYKENHFTDIPINSEYFKAVGYVYTNGIMKGTSNTMFSPNDMLKRCDLAVILYGMAGKPSVAGLSNPFTDVPANSYYYNAVKWAYNNGSNGIMAGISSTLFDPYSTINSQAAILVLKNFANRMGYSLKKIRNYPTFTNDSEILSWTRNAVIAMYEAGIIECDNNGNYNLSVNISRANIAMLIRKFEVVRLYS